MVNLTGKYRRLLNDCVSHSWKMPQDLLKGFPKSPNNQKSDASSSVTKPDRPCSNDIEGEKLLTDLPTHCALTS